MDSRSKLNYSKFNYAIKTCVSALGVLFGLGGFGHGFFEALQGRLATQGFYIHAIGPNHRFWEYGTEPAFTIFPNFLFAGVVTMIISLVIIIWSIAFMHRKHASIIFLLLFVFLFLSGGGIGQIIFFTIGWLISTRIRKPLLFWRRVLSENIRKSIAKFWKPALIFSVFMVLYSLQIAIFGYVPWSTDPKLIGTNMIVILCIGLIAYLFAFICACATDIESSNR